MCFWGLEAGDHTREPEIKGAQQLRSATLPRKHARTARRSSQLASLAGAIVTRGVVAVSVMRTPH